MSLTSPLADGRGIYLAGVGLGLLLTVAMNQFFPFGLLYGIAALGWLVSMFLPRRASPWPMIIGTLPLIPASLLFALFLFPFHVPIVAILLYGAFKSFAPLTKTARWPGSRVAPP